MNILFFVIGIIVAIFGVLLVVSPKTIVRMSDILNKTLAIDQEILSRRLIWGILLIIAGVYLFYRYITF